MPNLENDGPNSSIKYRDLLTLMYKQAMLLRLYALPSNRQHLSYDVCLEVSGEIIRTVLCCIVY